MYIDQFCAECVGGSKTWEHVESPCVSVQLVKIPTASPEQRVEALPKQKFKLLSGSYLLLDSYLRQEIA